MRLRQRLLAIGAALGLATATAIAVGASPALASTGWNFCNNNGSGYCLNDWGGLNTWGDSVNTYYGHSTNEIFIPSTVTGRCNNGAVTDTCPFANHAIDRRYAGSAIVQIEYFGSDGASFNNLCVATEAGIGYAMLGTCNDASGYHGDDGTIFIEHPAPSGGYYMISLYWTNNFNNYPNNDAACVEGGGLGDQVWLDQDTATGCQTWNSHYAS
jgi:hypothetical protein